METVAVILLASLLVWWLALTLWVLSCHRQRVRDAARPMTSEDLEEWRALEAGIARRPMRPKDYLLLAPFLLPVMLVMLPLYLYGWLAKDPDAGDGRRVAADRTGGRNA